MSEQNKVALVTGGGRRIGAAIVRKLHRAGMDVVIHYRSSSTEAEALRAELCALRPDSVSLLRAELSQISAAQGLVARCVAQHGRLDALINNASAFFPTPLQDATEAQWQRIFDTNLKAPFFLSQAAAPHLKKTRGGIVNIADLYAHRPLPEHAIYCASKAALVSMTKSLAVELGPEVRVNAVAPGAILWPENDADPLTQQRMLENTPLKRTGNADDIASAVVFLLRDAPFVNAQVLHVDGGRGAVAS